VHALGGSADRIALGKDVCRVFQQYNIFTHMTMLENIMLAPVEVLRQERDEARQRAIKLLAKVRLKGRDGAYPGHLSGGQQEGVVIARALDPETVKEY
jgi:polar amino acid transport system ATP-binding protein